MREFLVSCVSLSVILAVIWAILSVIIVSANYLITFGVPLELIWFSVGACVLLVKPGESLTRFSTKVWETIDEISVRFL
jgi:hypothetical protein